MAPVGPIQRKSFTVTVTCIYDVFAETMAEAKAIIASKDFMFPDERVAGVEVDCDYDAEENERKNLLPYVG
jgi:hypothetical protein